jgi:hypothetical protein
MWPKIEIKYQADDSYGFYWHLVDGYGNIRCWSGQGFGDDHAACVRDAQVAIATMRSPNLKIVNAY